MSPERSAPIQFLVAGTAKAGTTSLARYLSMHPEIHIPHKELFYFNAQAFESNCLPYPLQRPMDAITRTSDDFLQQMQGPEGKLIGEVGTGYLYHHQLAIPKIKALLGTQIPIFILLRNPVDRAYSGYMHFKKDCFEELPFSEALEMEYYRVQQQWDFMWHYRAMGLYYEQVKAYRENFQNVHVLLFDDLKADPQLFMTGVFERLGLEPLNTGALKTVNPSGTARFPWLQKMITHEHLGKKVLRPVVRALWNDKQRSRMRKYIKTKNLKAYPGLSPKDHAALCEYYRRDVRALSDLLGQDLTHWTQPRSNHDR